MKISTDFKLEATPERVYTVLKLIGYKAYTREEIISLIHPIKRETECGIVLNYLMDCGMVEEDSKKKYHLKIDPIHITSIKQFRKWVNSNIFKQDESTTFAFTKWYMGQEIDLLNKVARQLLKEAPNLLKTEREINAWRLWSKFIGLGTLHNGQFVPNPAIRIKDFVEGTDVFKVGTTVTVGEFIKALFNGCPELKDCVKDHQVGPFLSIGLRTLNQQKAIQLAYHQDYTEVWYLAPNSIYDTQITHITIGGESRE